MVYNKLQSLKSLKFKTIAVLGGRGMLGLDLVEFLNDYYKVTVIDKNNYEQHKGKSFDVLINANGNSRRFWANQNPFLDFEASTISVYKSLFDFKFKKYIYISSMYLYENYRGPWDEVKISPKKSFEDKELNVKKISPYSLHKYLSEQMVKRYASDYLIMRCSMMIGPHAKKGPLFDILTHHPLFITLSSKIQMITTEEVAKALHILISKNKKNEIYNIGGKGKFPFAKVEKYFSVLGVKKITVSQDAKEQNFEEDVSKLNKIFKLKTSEEYLTDFVKNYRP